MRTIIPVNARLIPESAKRVFEGRIYDTYQWEEDLYDGTGATFEMLKRRDTVKVVAIKDHKLVVILEEQPSMGAQYYGLPGGRHDVEGETELEGAQRELAEETGMTFAYWRLLTVIQPQSDIEHIVYTFLATGFESQTAQNLDAGEKIKVELIDLERARELAGSAMARHLPSDLLEQVNTIDELADLPQFGA